jgi:hypothetical protein
MDCIKFAAETDAACPMVCALCCDLTQNLSLACIPR